MMRWKEKEPAVPAGETAGRIPTEEEEYIEKEKFEFWHRFCENKTAVLGLVVMAAVILMAVFANVIADAELVTLQDISVRSQGPGAGHLFGTDGYGRDIFARVVFGARSSLFVALSSYLPEFCSSVLQPY